MKQSVKTSFCIWKWAENDLPARPKSILRKLRAGMASDSIQPFAAAGILRRLHPVLRKYQSRSVLAVRGKTRGSARMIEIRGDTENLYWLKDQLLRAVWKENLSLFNEMENRLESLPKINAVEAERRKQRLDIKPEEAKKILQQLDYLKKRRWLAFYDSGGNMFQVWECQKRYVVEWQILRNRDFSTHRIWVAGYRVRDKSQAIMGTRHDGVICFGNEALRSKDVLRLWAAFISTPAIRPKKYFWRETTANLKHTLPKRERHVRDEIKSKRRKSDD